MPSSSFARMFKLFSIAFQSPTNTSVEPLVDGTLRDEMKSNWEALGLAQDAIDTFHEDLGAYVGRDEDEILHELRREFTRLFLGDKPPIAHSEGMWRMRSEGRQAVLIINTYSLEVADFMRQCGVVKAEGYNDCIDYLDTECDFAALLADSPDYLIELGKDPSVLLDAFIDEHMKLWVPGFCIDVSRESSVLYYKALSALMNEFMKVL